MNGFDQLDNGAVFDKIQDAVRNASRAIPVALWHYTTGDGLLGILKDGTLRAAQISCLNDSSEYSYSSLIVFEAVKRFRLKGAYPPCLDELFKVFDTNMDVAKTSPYRLKANFFVSCFTEDGDSLTQWRSYGGGEGGYALGFDRVGLEQNESDFALRSVIYPDKDVLADEVCRILTEGFLTGYARTATDERAIWLQKYLFTLGDALFGIAGTVKAPAFKEEKEVRFLRVKLPGQKDEEEVDDLGFVQKNGFLSRFRSVRFRPSFKEESKLPLTCVRVGPARHQEISVESLKMLLRRHGYSAVDTVASPIPYRET